MAGRPPSSLHRRMRVQRESYSERATSVGLCNTRSGGGPSGRPPLSATPPQVEVRDPGLRPVRQLDQRSRLADQKHGDLRPLVVRGKCNCHHSPGLHHPILVCLSNCRPSPVSALAPCSAPDERPVLTMTPVPTRNLQIAERTGRARDSTEAHWVRGETSSAISSRSVPAMTIEYPAGALIRGGPRLLLQSASMLHRDTLPLTNGTFDPLYHASLLAGFVLGHIRPAAGNRAARGTS